MNQFGYIMLYRKIKDWRWYTDPNTFRLFIHLLLEASRKQMECEIYKLLPGQLITGRKALAKDLRLSERQIRTSINKLKMTNEVTVQTTNKFSIITICNWNTYQHVDQDERPAERPATGQTNDQQKTTYNNVRSKEKEKKSPIPPPFVEIEEYFAKTIENKRKSLDAKIEAEKFDAHYGSIDWMVGKTKMTDWKKSASGWILRATEFNSQRKQQINGYQTQTEPAL